MATSYFNLYLAELKANETEMTDLFHRLMAQIESILRHEARDGHIPVTRLEPVRRAVEVEVQRMFLAATGRRDMQPYEMIYGKLIPLSPVMNVLWKHIETVTTLGVQIQAGIMRKQLKDSPDVLAYLSRSDSNPFYNHQPPALLPGRDNLRLKDKLQRSATDTSRKVDLYLAEMLALGLSVDDMVTNLGTFLTPDAEITANNKPYGKNGLTEIMAFSRGDLVRNFNQSQITAADFNPFVENYTVIKYDGPCNSNCQEIADGGPYPKGDTLHCPPFHKSCFCRVTWNLTDKPAAVIADLRAAGPSKWYSPLQTEQFARSLLDSEYRLETA